MSYHCVLREEAKEVEGGDMGRYGEMSYHCVLRKEDDLVAAPSFVLLFL